MNHFQAVEKMRELAKERNLREIEIEIDWRGTTHEQGQNVNGQFQSGENQVKMFWDTAFQNMAIGGPFGSETIQF